MKKSASAPTSAFVDHSALSSSLTSSVDLAPLSLSHERPMGVSRLVASRMRLDATLSPAMLDLRMNARNLNNEMKYNGGKIVSHQFALMRPRRKQTLGEPEALPKEYAELKRKAMKRQKREERLQKQQAKEAEVNNKVRQARPGTGERGRPGTGKSQKSAHSDQGGLGSVDEDFSIDDEVERLLNDTRIEAVWTSFQDKDAAEDETHKKGLPRNRASRALEALGHSNPDAQIVEDTMRSLPGDDNLDLNEFISIVAVFNQQRRMMLREKFKSLDTDHSGTVSAKEFRHLLWDLGYSVTDSAVKEYLVEVDADHSGEVEFAEFEHACHLVHQRFGFTLAEVYEFESLFDRYDTDESGEMEATELASAIGWFGRACTLDVAMDIVKRFDDDGSGTISKPEFLMVMRSRQEEEISEMRATFAEFDEDNSGTMDIGELTRLFCRNGYSITEEVIQDSIKALRISTSELLFEDVLRLWHFIRKREGFSERELNELVDVFNRHDTAARGELREFELARALNWLGYPLSQQRRRELWCRVDVDKTESIEQNEFLKLVRLLREEETKWSEDLLEEVARSTHQGNQRKGHLPEPLLKSMLYKLGYFPQQQIINQALKQSCDATGDGQVDLQGILAMLRFIREKQVVKLRQSAGLSDRQVQKIRGKFGLRIEGGKHIEPPEFERFMYDIFPAARHSQESRERIRTLIKQHSSENGGIIDLMSSFWIVRLFSDARDEDTWRREQAAAVAAGFHSTQVAQFREAYVAADDNGDGCLSEREIQTVFEDLMSLNLTQVDRMRTEFHNLGDRKECIEFADFLWLMRIILDEGMGIHGSETESDD